MCALDDVREDLRDGVLQLGFACIVARVRDHMRGAFALFLERNLRCFAAHPLCFVPVTRGGNASRANLAWRVDKDDRIAFPIESDLKQKRRINDKRERVIGRGREIAQPLRMNARMHDRLDLLTQ